jgi:hypothetical protein
VLGGLLVVKPARAAQVLDQRRLDAPLAPASQRLLGGHRELLQPERLQEVLVHVVGHGPAQRVGAAVAGDQHGGGARMGAADLAREVESRPIREVQVAHHEVEVLIGQPQPRILQGGGLLRVETDATQLAREQWQQRGLVVNNETRALHGIGVRQASHTVPIGARAHLAHLSRTGALVIRSKGQAPGFSSAIQCQRP